MTNISSENSRSSTWKWAICGLLLSATMINYMDRQTLATLAKRITDEFHLSQEQYGNLEFSFGWAFAAGSLFFGILVDLLPVRWLYPSALLAWSGAGFATSFVESYDELIICRTLLGFFEAGHWPCALQTVQRLLSRSDRQLGNSLLQSGASLGAIFTPLIILGCLGISDPQSGLRSGLQFLVGGSGESLLPMPASAWQMPFRLIGLIGAFWIMVWFILVRRTDLQLREEDRIPVGEKAPSVLLNFPWRKFFALVVMVTALNGSWQLLRAWLPMFLQRGRGYSEETALYFNSVYYIATDIGCLTSGAIALALARRGMSVHGARLRVYFICCCLTALTTVVSITPAGWVLLGLLLLIGAGELGLFPCYYSFSQELSPHHIGKITGLLAAIGWFLSSPLHKAFGRVIDQTGSYDLGIALVGLLPLIGLAAMLLLWGKETDKPKQN